MNSSLSTVLNANADRLRRAAWQACYVPHWQETAFPFQLS